MERSLHHFRQRWRAGCQSRVPPLSPEDNIARSPRPGREGRAHGNNLALPDLPRRCVGQHSVGFGRGLQGHDCAAIPRRIAWARRAVAQDSFHQLDLNGVWACTHRGKPPFKARTFQVNRGRGRPYLSSRACKIFFVGSWFRILLSIVRAASTKDGEMGSLDSASFTLAGSPRCTRMQRMSEIDVAAKCSEQTCTQDVAFHQTPRGRHGCGEDRGQAG